MLNADQIEALRVEAETLLDPLINWLITDVAKRVAEAGQLTSTAQYRIWRLQNFGQSQEEIKKRVALVLNKSEKEVETLFTKAAETGYRFDLSRLPTENAIPFSENAVIQQIISAAVKMGGEGLENITQTLGFVGDDGLYRPLTQAYQKACDFAFLQTSTGSADYNTAIREATKNLRKQGIQTIEYESGRHISVDAAIRRNVFSALGTMQENVSATVHDDVGCDGWEISAHAASAPDHEPIQGRQYRDAEYKRLNDSLIRRIGTLNCGHAAFPIIFGVSEPIYSEKELDKLRRENDNGFEYEGKHYTRYEATQRQRQLERQIRKTKQNILFDEAAGDKDNLTKDRIRYVRLSEEYKRFSEEAGLKSQHARLEEYGFGPKQAEAAEVVAGRNYAVVETIGKSVGAKAKNYRIYNPVSDGEMSLTEGTRITQPKDHIMAGKNRDRQIDEIDFLLDKYGGDPLEWTKEKGFGYVDDEYGDSHYVEIHWYQEPSVGKVKFKIKVQQDGRIYIEED